MTTRRPASLLIVATLAFGASFATPATAGAATTWHFPSTDCPQSATGLQDCIDRTTAGDTIQVDLDPLASQFAAISHSLTLKAAPGLDPTLGGVDVDDLGGTGAMDVTIEGLSFVDHVEAHLSGGTGHTLTIKDVTVTEQPDASSAGISLVTSVPSSFRVIGSDVRFTGQSGGILLEASSASGSVEFQAIGNRTSAPGAGDSGSGIEVDTAQAGSVRADILNNVVWDVGTCSCGSSAGISLSLAGSGQVQANVVGNTVDRARTGDRVSIAALYVGNSLSTGGHVVLSAFDNVLAHSSIGFEVQDAVGSPRAVVRAGYNDFFKNTFSNDLDGRGIGSHNLTRDPAFVDEAHGDLRLKPSSGVIDKGEVCSPGGVANLDAAGHGRLAGASVDIGAYERRAGAPSGIAQVGTNAADTLTGTSGDDILCGGGGNDHLHGMAGNDYIDGGSGNDLLVGGPGSDRLFGRSGNDTLCARDGSHGNDAVDGGPGVDRYQADPGDAKVSVEHTGSCPAV